MRLLGSPRTRALGTLCKRLGASAQQKEWATLAVEPYATAPRPRDRPTGKQIEAMARRFAQRMHRAGSADELQERTYIALSAYAYLSRQAGAEQGAAVFEAAAFACRVEITPERLEELKQEL